MNLNLPISGIKGSLMPGETATAIFPKINPGSQLDGEPELSKVGVNLSWKFDVSKFEQ